MTPGRVWAAWLTANVAPSLVVAAIILALRRALGVNQLVVIAFVLLFGLVAWLQARVWVRWRMRREGGASPRVLRWTAWTVGGLVVAMFFGVGTLATLDGLGSETLGLVLGWLVAGLVVGLAQAFVLGFRGFTRCCGSAPAFRVGERPPPSSRSCTTGATSWRTFRSSAV